MANYNVDKIFKQLSPEHFNALAEAFRVDIRMDQEDKKNGWKAATDRWTELLSNGSLDKESLRGICGLHDFLQNLNDLAGGKCDITACAHTLAMETAPTFLFPPEFDSWSRYDQGAYLYLHNRSLWENVDHVATASNISSSKLWTVFTELPRESLCRQPETVTKLEGALVSFFAKTKPSKTCRIKSYSRGASCYYFATLRDRRQYLEVHNETTDTFEPLPVVLPFRLIFCYDDDEGEFSIHGELGKPDIDALANMITSILLGRDCTPTRAPKPVYDLGPLKRREFVFSQAPDDGIDKIWIKSLTITPEDDPHMQITIRHSTRNIYDCLDEVMDKNRLSTDNIDVQKAVIGIRMLPGHPKFRSLTFEIRAHGNDLHNLCDSKRLFGEKYIKQWGLKVG